VTLPHFSRCVPGERGGGNGRKQTKKSDLNGLSDEPGYFKKFHQDYTKSRGGPYLKMRPNFDKAHKPIRRSGRSGANGFSGPRIGDKKAKKEKVNLWERGQLSVSFQKVKQRGTWDSDALKVPTHVYKEKTRE